MINLAEKEREIEIARARLHLLVEQKNGDFSNKDVAEQSIYLDKLIVAYELANGRRPSKN
ncbi:aspartyl-phosphate phosphatase Spo0E family protein [Sporomusa malonica]|uniref:Spo0E like sporulation regulatory protein n=1 Tax=Sporomusa malonica TaxID=112901 RepID=A0A1W2DDP7_9FIRM|nr:aspartyl-phosphate phosphatase Spo0E family protein [Sporomusa malonica]SMC95669.1 Spo0E like sporulation regulatory protein [Sporomusa malonica]